LPNRTAKYAWWKDTRITISILCAVALIPRLIDLLFFIDAPDDGLWHTFATVVWSQTHSLELYRCWLPGYALITGLFNTFFNNPLISNRILNICCGTITIPIFYSLIKKIYNYEIAFISALLLAFLPLHIELSATSMTEPLFILFFIAATRAFILQKNNSFVIFLAIASTIRYEAWLFIPIFLLFYFLRNKNTPLTILYGATLLLFPIVWMIGSYHARGDAIYGFHAGHVPRNIPNILAPIIMIKNVLFSGIGPFMTLCACTGLIFRVRENMKNVSHEEPVYLSITALAYLSIIYHTLTANNAWPRFMLLSFILILPFVAWVLFYILTRVKKLYAMSLFLAIVIFHTSRILYGYHNIYLTNEQPVEMEKVATWLSISPYRNNRILMTPKNGETAYLHFFYNDSWSHCLGIAGDNGLWDKGSVERSISAIQSGYPAVFLTCPADSEYKKQFEIILGNSINTDLLIYDDKQCQIYDISQLIKSAKEYQKHQ
jgi:hypothetical protein